MRIWPSKKRVKTPTVLQMEAVECGAAALGIILAYYGKFVPLEELRIRCGVSRDGSKASNMAKAATYYGLAVRACRSEVEELKALTFPVIIFWNFNHFLVVEGFSRKGVYLNDPKSGPRLVTYEDFHQSFTGIVLTFTPTPTFQKSGRKTSALRGLIDRLGAAKKDLIFIVLTTLLLTIPGMGLPVFSRVFVDDYLVHKMQSWIMPLLLGMLLTAILRAMLTWLQQQQL